MLATRDFLLRARLDAETLEAWVEAGWLVPRRDGGAERFSEVDFARARLIRDLQTGHRRQRRRHHASSSTWSTRSTGCGRRSASSSRPSTRDPRSSRGGSPPSR